MFHQDIGGETNEIAALTKDLYMLINVKMPIVGILTFMTRIIFTFS